MRYKLSQEEFNTYVTEHQLDIIKDDGVYRQLFCGKSTTRAYSWSITTWPGYLCISGDIGCYVFSRTNDMFNFFVSDKWGINPGYWAEKLQAVDRDNARVQFNNGYKSWCSELLRENLEFCFEGYFEEDNIKMVDKFYAEYPCDKDMPYEVYEALSEFESDNGYQFDFWEYDNMDYTHNYLFALYAIVWTIKKYRELSND